jgi:5-amino-6-(5-phosphoribosylamino)uracil reductase
MAAAGTSAHRPYVVLSCAVSIDGYLDDISDTRLLLSSDEDFDRVDGLRASCDAILVGATTVRRDDPRLLIRSAERRAERRARGLPAHPLRVTLTGSGNLDPNARLFVPPSSDDDGQDDDGRHDDEAAALGGHTLVYTSGAGAGATRSRLRTAPRVEIVELGDVELGIADVGTLEVRDIARAVDTAELCAVLADLAARGVRRLLVEGGARLLSRLLGEGIADELQLVVAPLIVGVPPERERRVAPRITIVNGLPSGAERLRLVETRTVGDCVLLRYLLPGTRGQD